MNIAQTPAKEALKPLVIYHGNCTDGFGAAWCFWNQFGDSFEYFAGHYGKPTPDVTDREVYIVDFSYKRSVMEGLIFAAKHITWIDHHESARKDLDGLEADNFLKCFDNEHSGAMLAWDFVDSMSNPSMLQETPPELIRHIQDRDLWKFEIHGTKEIMAAVFSYPFEFEVWDSLMGQEIEDLYEEGRVINRKTQKDVASIIKTNQRIMTMDVNGCDYHFPICNASGELASEVGEALYVACPEWFVGTYYDTDKERKFSLRSMKGTGGDVSTIAAYFGGGGHKHAAGFSVPRTHYLAKA